MNMEKLFAEAVQQIHARYAQYGKRGKPESRNQWTHIAALFTIQEHSKSIDIVSVCTGTKCVTDADLNWKGGRLLDSHAETLARRAFVKFLLGSMKDYHKSPVKFLKMANSKFVWDQSFNLYMYASHLPCGSASADLNIDDNDEYNPIVKIARTDSFIDNPAGAFCRKPGKGAHTLSMSCSDKLCKLSVMGVQGALLANYLHQPIYLKGIVLNKCFQGHHQRVLQSITGRCVAWVSPNQRYVCHVPTVHYVDTTFQYSPSSIQRRNADCQTQASHLSFMWYPSLVKPEVLVDGFKQGVSKKLLGTPKSQSCLCRVQMLGAFLAVTQELGCGDSKSPELIYRHCKDSSYLDVWSSLKTYFAQWNMHENKLKAQMFMASHICCQ